MKTDKSLHNICIAAIKRSITNTFKSECTKFYESNVNFKNGGLQLDLIDGEEIICSTIIDEHNYSVLTTKRLVTKEANNFYSQSITGAPKRLYFDFKDYLNTNYTKAYLCLNNGKAANYFYEKGKASIIMARAISTLVNVTQPKY